MHESPVTIRHYRPSDLPLLRQITVDSFGSVSLDQSLEQKLGRWNERDWKARKADHIAAAVLITDIDGIIEYVNPAACEAYGYSSAELLGANPRLIGSGLTPISTYQAMWSTILAGKAWRGELANRRRDGSLIHEAVSISPVYDRAGQMTHFVSLQEDVSARVEAERLQDELKTRLGRVAGMDVLGVMAGGVAHDFNNILVAILGFSGLGKTVLRATGGAERLVSYFEEIEAAGERARALVHSSRSTSTKRSSRPWSSRRAARASSTSRTR